MNLSFTVARVTPSRRAISAWLTGIQFSKSISAIMVEMTNAISAKVERPIQFFHLPVPKPRTDDGFFKPLERLALKPETELYLGLIHHNDPAVKILVSPSGRGL